MAAMVPAAQRDEGTPGTASTACPTSMTGRAVPNRAAALSGVASAIATSSDRRPARPFMKDAEPMRAKGGRASSRRCSQALSAISGPMPAGSPCVSARTLPPAMSVAAHPVRDRGAAVDLVLVADLADRPELQPEHDRLVTVLRTCRCVLVARRIGDAEQRALVLVDGAERQARHGPGIGLGVGHARVLDVALTVLQVAVEIEQDRAVQRPVLGELEVRARQQALAARRIAELRLG